MASAHSVKGCCPLDCPDTCAWVAHVEEGRVVRVEGAREHPITRGVLCAKVRDYQERTYAPDRLLHPLMRCGPKGSGEFRRIGWDEALNLIAERFSAILETDGPEALLPFNYLGSMGVVQRQSLMRLFHALGAWGHHYISVNHPAISPLGESRSHGEVMRALAERLGLEDSALQASDEEIAAASLPPELSLAELKTRGWWKSSPEKPARANRGVKWRLAGPGIEALSQQESEVLQLLTPKSHYFLNSTFANIPRQRKAQGLPALEMHSADAAKRGLGDGQRIVMANGRARVDVLLRISDAIRPGVVSLEGKWWDQPQQTSAVANFLSNSSQTPSGQPAYNDTFVRVISACES